MFGNNYGSLHNLVSSLQGEPLPWLRTGIVYTYCMASVSMQDIEDVSVIYVGSRREIVKSSEALHMRGYHGIARQPSESL